MINNKFTLLFAKMQHRTGNFWKFNLLITQFLL